MRTCPTCGQSSPEGFRFCGACGAALYDERPAAREERKRVSVLFCDLVGFTSRAEAMDPEEVRGLLQPYHARVRDELERHGGTVEKFIGDAVVAFFGAPTAHEDDPERAVRAALAIRDRVAGEDLHVRIGVTTGEALVVLDARPETGEGMASGDVVNTAARLQAAAPIDGILVDESTYRATVRAIEFRDHPPVDAKGKTVPVSVWEPATARSRLGLDVGEATSTPLVGRDLELGVLTAALARTRDGRTAHLVTLVGVPGIGKSRLVLELFRLVEEDPDPIRWRQGRCLPYGDGATLWALGEVVKAEVGILETDSTDEAETKLTAAVGEIVGDRDVEVVARYLRPLIGLDGSTTIAGERRDEAFAAWRRFFEGVTEQTPLVLVLEDLQWADDTLLDFVDYLVEWATDTPLLVVATSRPEFLARRPNWSGGKTNAVIQSLTPLSDQDTTVLAHAILGRTLLPAEVQESLVAAAGGNPLYAEEFARIVGEGGMHAVGAELPDSVQGIIAARLDVLEPADKALLQDAAVLGKVFWLGALEAIGGERSGLEGRIHELERREIVRRDRQSAVAGERQYAFRHLLLRDVAYGQIPRARRIDKHASAARWIESLSPDRSDDRAGMLAHHWSEALGYATATGRDTGDLAEKTRASLVDAANRAMSLNAPADAAAFFERALELGSTPATRLQYGRSLYLAADRRASAVLTQARDELAGSGDSADEAFAEAMLADILYLEREFEEGAAHLNRAVDLMQALPASVEKGWVLTRAAGRASNAGRSDDAMRLAQEAFAIGEQLDLDDVRIHALTTLGGSRIGLGDPGGLDDVARAYALAVASGSREAARAATNLGINAFLLGDLTPAWRLLREAEGHARRFGDVSMARWIQAVSVSSGYMLGDWDDALAAADDFLEAVRDQHHYQEPFVRSFRAMIRFGRDEVAAALIDLNESIPHLDPAADPQALAVILGMGGPILLELGDPRGPALAQQAADLRIGTEPEPMTIAHLPLLDLPPAVEERVRVSLAESVVDSPWVRAARAAMDGDFARAAEIYQGMPLRPSEARARMRNAEQLVAAGRRVEADEQLDRAIEFWRSVGAARYLHQAEALLRATA